MAWSLRARFTAAGLVILVAVVITGVWSTVLFSRLGNVVDRTLQGRQGIIDLTARMTSALERHDDALVLGLNGDVARARAELAEQRLTFDRAADDLVNLVTPMERAVVDELRAEVAIYRREGDALLAGAPTAAAWDRYHREVNPLLRKVVAECATLREHSFEALRDAGLAARDEARRGRWVVAAVAIGALLASALVAWALARSVLRPIRELTASVEAMRGRDFTQRVERRQGDELGALADGFNRMAESLVAWESSNLAEVLRAKETLEATLAALPDAVIVADRDGRIVSRNAPARALLGEAPLPAAAQELVDAVLAGEAPPPAKQVVLDGTTYLPFAVAIPKFGAVAVLHDITEFVRVDMLRSELIAVTSHELKTPLTTLRMNLLLLGEEAGGLSPRHRELLTMAVQGCEELARTIDRLLDLSRIEAGKLRLAMERIDLHRVVDEVVQLFQPRFAEAELALEVARKDNGEACVRGDALRLGIVLSNLLTNAIKYTPAGGRVTVETSRAGEELELAVTDTGPGIPDDLRDRVFEKFFRVEHVRPRERAPNGAGVGLYICRQIIEAHGGQIHAEAVSVGSRLAFRLPAEAQAAA
ncbi:MAG: HAMP domain-containing protein [Myxococcales bacterium]|nr:HAMP domain-containing protein [Myxococcales bacterium]